MSRRDMSTSEVYSKLGEQIAGYNSLTSTALDGANLMVLWNCPIEFYSSSSNISIRRRRGSSYGLSTPRSSMPSWESLW